MSLATSGPCPRSLVDSERSEGIYLAAVRTSPHIKSQRHVVEDLKLTASVHLLDIFSLWSNLSQKLFKSSRLAKYNKTQSCALGGGFAPYRSSTPFGYIFPLVKSISKAFQILPSCKIQQNPKLRFGFWYFVSTGGFEPPTSTL